MKERNCKQKERKKEIVNRKKERKNSTQKGRKKEL